MFEKAGRSSVRARRVGNQDVWLVDAGLRSILVWEWPMLGPCRTMLDLGKLSERGGEKKPTRCGGVCGRSAKLFMAM